MCRHRCFWIKAFLVCVKTQTMDSKRFDMLFLIFTQTSYKLDPLFLFIRELCCELLFHLKFFYLDFATVGGDIISGSKDKWKQVLCNESRIICDCFWGCVECEHINVCSQWVSFRREDFTAGELSHCCS